MKPSAALDRHRAEVRQIIEENRGLNPRVFGSVSRSEDTEESDLDILVDPAPGMTYFDIGAIRYKLKDVLGVPVDVATPGALPDRFRAEVMAMAQPI